MEEQRSDEVSGGSHLQREEEGVSPRSLEHEPPKPEVRGFETDGEWLLLMGGSVKMKILTEQKEGNFPEHGQRVELSFDGFIIQPDLTKTLFCKVERQTFCIGSSDLVPGLELAARHLRAGEIAVVQCASRFGFADRGWNAAPGTDEIDVPPGANLEFKLESRSLGPRAAELEGGSGPAAAAARLADARARKAAGNWHAAHGDPPRAARAYRAARNSVSLEHYHEGSDDYDQAVKLLVDCGNNLALVLTKQNELAQAKEAVVEVLTLCPNNVKALCRAAQLCTQMDNFKEADLALKRAAEIEPESPEVPRLAARLARRRAAARRRGRRVRAEMAARLLGGGGDVGGAEGNEGSGGGGRAVPPAAAAVADHRQQQPVKEEVLKSSPGRGEGGGRASMGECCANNDSGSRGPEAAGCVIGSSEQREEEDGCCYDHDTKSKTLLGHIRVVGLLGAAIALVSMWVKISIENQHQQGGGEEHH